MYAQYILSLPNGPWLLPLSRQSLDISLTWRLPGDNTQTAKLMPEGLQHSLSTQMHRPKTCQSYAQLCIINGHDLLSSQAIQDSLVTTNFSLFFPPSYAYWWRGSTSLTEITYKGYLYPLTACKLPQPSSLSLYPIAHFTRRFSFCVPHHQHHCYNGHRHWSSGVSFQEGEMASLSPRWTHRRRKA